MPFDQATYPKTKHDIFSLEGLRDWLQEQDPDTEYDYWDIHNCLLCQYGRGRGLKVQSAGGDNICFFPQPTSLGAKRQAIPGSSSIVISHPHTMGGALARVEAQLEPAQ